MQPIASKLAERRKLSSNIKRGKGKTTKNKDGNGKQKLVGKSADTSSRQCNR